MVVTGSTKDSIAIKKDTLRYPVTLIKLSKSYYFSSTGTNLVYRDFKDLSSLMTVEVLHYQFLQHL
jgi:hypothetical protein